MNETLASFVEIFLNSPMFLLKYAFLAGLGIALAEFMIFVPYEGLKWLGSRIAPAKSRVKLKDRSTKKMYEVFVQDGSLRFEEL